MRLRVRTDRSRNFSIAKERDLVTESTNPMNLMQIEVPVISPNLVSHLLDHFLNVVQRSSIACLGQGIVSICMSTKDCVV